MDKIETLVVPEELGIWLEDMEIGQSSHYFTMIDALNHYWETIITSKTGGFITDNKKELIEVIIGSRGYRVETPLYYALVKGHELSSNELKYWNCEAYNLGHVFVGRKEPESRCINRMTKKNWYVFGINESNADFIEIEEMTE